jgi:hypothetical protein
MHPQPAVHGQVGDGPPAAGGGVDEQVAVRRPERLADVVPAQERRVADDRVEAASAVEDLRELRIPVHRPAGSWRRTGP